MHGRVLMFLCPLSLVAARCMVIAESLLLRLTRLPHCHFAAAISPNKARFTFIEIFFIIRFPLFLFDFIALSERRRPEFCWISVLDLKNSGRFQACTFPTFYSSHARVQPHLRKLPVALSGFSEGASAVCMLL